MELTESRRRRAAIAATIGNALEWFDFAVYGYFASVLGRVFFPESDAALQTVASFGIFALGYLARPLGSLVLGPIGDVLGRRQMLTLCIATMGLSSVGIALLPTYATAGAAAAYLLLALRLVQGFSIGGEYTGSIAYSTEAAPAGRQGVMTSLATAGALLGFALGSLLASLLSALLDPDALYAWGWRVPFLLGAPVAVAAMWLRLHMPETLPSAANRAAGKTPASAIVAEIGQRIRSVARQWRMLARIGALVAFANVVFYVLFVYLVDRASQHDPAHADAINGVSTATQTIAIAVVVLGGWLADRFGRVTVTRWATWLGAVLVVPAILLAQRGDPVALAGGQLLMLVPVMVLFGTHGVLVARLVRQDERCAVFSVGYSIAIAAFGGTAPVMAGWMLEARGWDWGPALYCLAFAVPALIALRGVTQEA